MKKIIPVMFLLTLAFGVSAQEGFHLGAGGGLYSSWIINQNAWGNPELEYATTFGNQFHLIAGYRLTDNIGIQVEPGFTSIGQNYDGKMLGFDSERSIDLSYITIPVLLHFTSNGDVTRFHLLAGPQFGILSKADHTFSGLPFPFMTNGDVSERFESSDIFGVLDIGADIFLDDNFFISAGLRLSYGLMDINQDDPNWRIKNFSGIYEPSHNFYTGLNIGINYVFD